MEIDVKQLDRANASIDAQIENRAALKETANREAQREAERLQAYQLGKAGELRQEWIEFYRCQIAAAENMRARAVERLGKLLDEGTG